MPRTNPSREKRRRTPLGYFPERKQSDQLHADAKLPLFVLIISPDTKPQGARGRTSILCILILVNTLMTQL